MVPVHANAQTISVSALLEAFPRLTRLDQHRAYDALHTLTDLTELSPPDPFTAPDNTEAIAQLDASLDRHPALKARIRSIIKRDRIAALPLFDSERLQHLEDVLRVPRGWARARAKIPDLIVHLTKARPHRRQIQDVRVYYHGHPLDLEDNDPLTIFGHETSPHKIASLLQIDAEGYRVKRLEVSLGTSNQITLFGIIENAVGHRVGDFFYTISPPPKQEPIRSLSVARVKQFNFQFAPHRPEIDFCLTQRFLAFLGKIGVDTLEFTATTPELYDKTLMGFDFADDATREAMLIACFSYSRKMGLTLSPNEEESLRSVQHAWQLADLRLEDGRELGREFLRARVPSDKPYRLRFFTRPDYIGWQRLLIPPHWEDFPVQLTTQWTDFFRENKLITKITRDDIHNACMVNERLNQILIRTTPSILTFDPDEPPSSKTNIDQKKTIRCMEHSASIIMAMHDATRPGNRFAWYFWAQMKPVARKRVREILGAIDQIESHGFESQTLHDLLSRQDQLKRILSYPDAWNAFHPLTSSDLIEQKTLYQDWGHEAPSIEQHGALLLERLGFWLAALETRLADQGAIPDSDRVFSDTRISDLLQKIADVLKYTIDEWNTETELGRTFWQNLTAQQRHSLRSINETIDRFLNMRLSFSRLLSRVLTESESD